LRGSVDLKTESVDAKLINSSGNIVFNTKGGNLDIEKTKGTIKLNMISGNINLAQCEGDISNFMVPFVFSISRLPPFVLNTIFPDEFINFASTLSVFRSTEPLKLLI
jgi:hypothetical protein